MIDAVEGLTEQDKKIAGYAHEAGKGILIVVNKWDLIEKDTNTVNKFNQSIKEDLKFMDYLKTIFVSAKTGQRTDKVLDLAIEVYENAGRRISTGQLNDLILDCVRVSEPPSVNGKRLKVSFATQVAVYPPNFVLFVNETALMHFSYKRYIENSIRRAYDFSGTPIKISVREKEDE